MHLSWRSFARIAPLALIKIVGLWRMQGGNKAWARQEAVFDVKSNAPEAAWILGCRAYVFVGRISET